VLNTFCQTRCEVLHDFLREEGVARRMTVAHCARLFKNQIYILFVMFYLGPWGGRLAFDALIRFVN
jgi:hypothetical protein